MARISALVGLLEVMSSAGKQGSRPTRRLLAFALPAAGGMALRQLVTPVASSAAQVEDARNEGAAEILDAMAESRLDEDLWQVIRQVPAKSADTEPCPDCLDPASGVWQTGPVA